jgi:CHAT domain-containing protein
MVALIGGLCLILILGTTGSRSPGVPSRSPGSSEWWDRASKHIQTQALSFRRAGDYASAEKLYQQGYEGAVQRHDPIGAIKYLMSVGGCQIGEFRYRAALETLLRARSLAASVGDKADLGGIAVNLSSVYTQMWDYGAALQAAQDGMKQVADLANNVSVPYLLLQIGRLHSMTDKDDAVPFLARGIEAVRNGGSNVALEAQAWDWLGKEYLKRKQIPDAERAFLEAFRLRTLFHKVDLGYSYSFLGALNMAEGDVDGAERFTMLALEASRKGAPSWPEYLLRRQQGQIETARGHTAQALIHLAAAAEGAARWREEVIPAKSALTESNIGLDKDVVREFAEQAAEQAIQSGSGIQKWSERAFQALELNRAASLRESIALRDVWRERLPSKYWEALGRLQAIAFRPSNPAHLEEEARLRLEISEMEAQAGLQFSWNKGEIFRTQNSLIHFRDGIGKSDLLVSFLLGEEKSYLWAVTREGMNLYPLAAKREIAKAAREFREAAQNGRPEAIDRGYELYGQLFGQLSRRERGKQDWFLSVEDALFDVPYAALVTEYVPEHVREQQTKKGGKAVYLVEGHSIQTIPGALFGGARSSTHDRTRGLAARAFLGVGDPIYNAADPRAKERTTALGGQLSRLPSSGPEVEASAKAWSGPATILLGRDARRQEFLNALNQSARSQSPSVIHLATHVGVQENRRDQAWIAFSLTGRDSNRPAQLQYLDTRQVSALHLSEALVVMTGCETGAGDARQGAGLLGLTRAWLMAGASGVIATNWPVEDTTGEIFSRFYRLLRNSTPAEALRQSQIEMLHAGSWRSDPSYWAAYQLTGGLN